MLDPLGGMHPAGGPMMLGGAAANGAGGFGGAGMPGGMMQGGMPSEMLNGMVMEPHLQRMPGRWAGVCQSLYLHGPDGPPAECTGSP